MFVMTPKQANQVLSFFRKDDMDYNMYNNIRNIMYDVFSGSENWIDLTIDTETSSFTLICESVVLDNQVTKRIKLPTTHYLFNVINKFMNSTNLTDFMIASEFDIYKNPIKK